MNSILMAVIGVVVFFAGYYKIQENKKTGASTKFYALVAYAGLAFGVVGTMGLITPLLSGIPEQPRSFLVAGVEVGIFFIGAELLIKPEFERKTKDKGHLSDYGKYKKDPFDKKNKKKK